MKKTARIPVAAYYISGAVRGEAASVPRLVVGAAVGLGLAVETTESCSVVITVLCVAFPLVEARLCF